MSSIKIIFDVHDDHTLLVGVGENNQTPIIDITDTEVEQELKMLLMKIVSTYSDFSSLN